MTYTHTPLSCVSRTHSTLVLASAPPASHTSHASSASASTSAPDSTGQSGTGTSSSTGTNTSTVKAIYLQPEEGSISGNSGGSGGSEHNGGNGGSSSSSSGGSGGSGSRAGDELEGWLQHLSSDRFLALRDERDAYRYVCM
jgi:hypothetical protein